MFKFLLGRLVQMAILFVVFLSLVWLLLQAMPGDISDTLVGNPSIPLSVRLELRESLGLSQPLHIQYLTYITNFFRGELGVSFSRYPQDVSAILWTALPRTLVLFLSATLLAFWLGFKTGKLIAWGRGAGSEKGLIVTGIFLQTVFYPWFAIVMLWTFGFFFGWFPIGRFIDARLWQGSPFNANEIFGQMIVSVIIATVIYVIGRYLIKRYARDIVTQTRLGQGLAAICVGALVLFWWLHPAAVYVADIAHHTMLPVMTLGLVAFGATMLLTRSAMLETLGEDYILTATLFAFWLGFKTGKLIAWGRGASSEKGLIVTGIFLQTVFYPWFAILMLWTFGFFLGWFPIGRFIDARLWQNSPYDANELFGQMIITALIAFVVYAVGRYLISRYSNNIVTQGRLAQGLGVLTLGSLVLYWWVNPAREYTWDITHHTMLPVFTLGLVLFGATMLLTRSAMLETLGEDYILTARAKGLPDRVIRDRHAARNAMLPVTTSLVLALAFEIGGGIVTETIFSWPGMGLIFLQAINVSDIPLADGALSITGVLALFGHLLADVLYAVLDPRIRVA